jgi:hypothetical protein
MSLLQKSFNVIPGKAGIQVFQGLMDPGCHRGGGFVEFCKRLKYLVFAKPSGTTTSPRLSSSRRLVFGFLDGFLRNKSFTGPGAYMQKPARSRAILVLLLCAVVCGCTRMEWSGGEVAGLSLDCLIVIGFIMYAANRLTLDAAGPPQGGRLGPFLCLAGLFTVILGAKLHLINAFGSDVPFWDQWDAEAPSYSLLIKGALDPSRLVRYHNEHRLLLTRLLLFNLFDLNGQWDPLLEMAVNVFIHALMLTCLCMVLWRLAGRKHLAEFCIALALIGVRPFSWDNTLQGFQSQVYFVLGFSILAMLLLLGSRPFSFSWLLGVASSVCAYFSQVGGIFAPAAVACLLLFACLTEPRRWKEFIAAFIFLISLCAMAYAFVPHLAHHEPLRARNFLDFFSKFGTFAAWPLENWLFGPILWSPVLILALRQISSRKVSGLFEQFLMALGIWTLLHTAAFAYARGNMAVRYYDIMAMGSVANFAALLLLLRPLYNGVLRRAAIVLGAVALVACAGLAVFHWNLPADLLERHIIMGIEEENTARYVLTGDTSSLMDKPFLHIPYPNAERLIAVLKDPLVFQILPAGIRAPIFLNQAEGYGFAPASIPPDLPARPHRVVAGSWQADRGKARAVFVSQPVASRFSWLVFDIAGGGPGTSMELRPTSGKPAVPVPVEKKSTGWRQVIVPAPEGSFTVRAADDGDSWLAFTWPRELAAGGYFERWFAASGVVLMIAGLLGLLVGIAMSLNENLDACSNRQASA